MSEIAEEETFLAKLARVFSTPEGIEVAEWILHVTGYWRPVKDLALFEAGRLFVLKLAEADLDLWRGLVERQQRRAVEDRAGEKRKLNERLKETR